MSTKDDFNFLVKIWYHAALYRSDRRQIRDLFEFAQLLSGCAILALNYCTWRSKQIIICNNKHSINDNISLLRKRRNYLW